MTAVLLFYIKIKKKTIKKTKQYKPFYFLFLFLKEKNNLNVVYKSSIFYPQIFVKKNKLALKMTIIPYELCFETLLHVFKRNKNH